MSDRKAEEVRQVLDAMPEIDHTGNVPESIEGFATEVVERGTFWPDCRITADLSLTPRERLTGKRKQDVTAMLCIGLVLGAALERDVPMDTDAEDAWRDGEFVLPEASDP